MNPRWLFPLLALAFLVAALLRAGRRRRLDPAVRAWGLLALVFGAVSAWLHGGAAT
ncbi:hypothetical protein G8A07_23850 [Roseateles sp. DAIF2]|uniref:hypothetical protein n=1 Tax=Roseateles sp. DAIF2 TaxID=2714952 RepID=UPI0018A2A989|nr:hypothetical protein [Roseateles sp. DAIF2]QPF75648.1 hypothetical protein G8A07_23850 [Roseateles sp. DAIF2]